MDADGANARLLVAMRGASQPAWSPDGRYLLTASNEGGNGDIYLISVEEAAIRDLTAGSSADEVDPLWLP